jgi:hypothetical protein
VIEFSRIEGHQPCPELKLRTTNHAVLNMLPECIREKDAMHTQPRASTSF